MEDKKVDKTTLAFAFENPALIAVWEGKPDRMLDVRMTVDDLLAIVDLANERREKQQKRGIRVTRRDHGFSCRCNQCGTELIFYVGNMNFENTKKLIKTDLDSLLIPHFCKICGNDLRGKVHFT